MHKPTLFFAVTLFSLLLTGCASPFVVTSPNPETGRFPTESSVASNEYKVFKPIDNLADQQFSILLTSLNSPMTGLDGYPSYIEGMLKKCGIEDFVDFEYLEDFVIANGLGDKVPTLNNRIGLHQLSKYTGPYLIISADLTNEVLDRWSFTISVYDPVSSKLKFQVSHHNLVFFGRFREALLHPTFNALQEWLEASREAAPQKNEHYGT